MRSLTILQERSFTFLGPTKLRIASEQRTSGASEPSTAQPRGLRQFCVDLQDRDVYIAVTESREGHGVPGDKAWSSSDASATFTVIYQLLGDGSFPIRDNSTEWIEVARIPEPDYGGQPRELVSLQFIPDSSSLCLAFSDGDLYLIRHDRGRPARAEDVENVGNVESGISAMEWSPDRESFVLATGKGTLLEMTKDFDVVMETELNPAEAGQESMVSVGWGKKETQFHGSEGKAAAQRKEVVEEATVSGDHLKPQISWKGDGQTFATLIVEENRGRILRIYNREGGLLYTGEKISLLGDRLAWRPQGNLIASYQHVGGKINVIFFEPNGLRHGQFALREPASTRVMGMCWNADSSLFAIHLQRDGSSTGVVQIWSTSNYHWYLKQEIRQENDDIVSLSFDPEDPLVLHILSREKSYTCFRFAWETLRNNSTARSSLGTIGVVDGTDFLLTPMAIKNVPPPMFASKLDLPSSVAHASFIGDGPEERCLLLLCDGTLLCYRYTVSDRNITPSLEWKQVVDDHRPRQAALLSPTSFALLYRDIDADRDIVVVYGIASLDLPNAPKATVRASLPGSGALRLVFSAAQNLLIVEGVDGSLYQISVNGQDSEPVQESELCSKLPNPTAALEVVVLRGLEGDQIGIASLDQQNRLYWNNRLLASDVTSFFCHADFLIFTTLANRAKFLPLEVATGSIVSESSVGPGGILEEVSRRIERGAMIVTALHGGQSLILQMPRGNLETIYPRPLALTTVKSHLEKLEYKEALSLCRRHRMDLNVLVDHDRPRFLENIERFLLDVDNIEFINLFISSLNEIDITKSLYSPLYPRTSTNASSVSEAAPSKVNSVCDALLSVMDRINPVKYEQPILVAFVKKSPPEYEKALLRILEIKASRGTEAAEEALRYAIFLSDVRNLYDVALGMYDFELVLMVAQQSQMDPKEYLPFIKELKTHEGPYQKYVIDNHLKRRDKAIAHLANAGPDHFDAFLEYMEEHSLYRNASELFPDGDERFQIVMHRFGTHLLSQSKYDAAGLVFERAKLYEDAVEAYSKALSWREALSVAALVPYDEEKLIDLGQELADELAQEGRFEEAGNVQRDVLKDYKASVEMLVKGLQWAEALRVATTYNAASLVQDIIQPGALEEYETMLESLREQREKFEQMHTRLLKVRADKIEAKNRAALQDEDDVPDEIDMMSDTTSMRTRTTASLRSGGTKSSGRTSKSRRKDERKRLSGKEGSAYEEEYLVVTLRSAVQTAHTTGKAAARDLAKILVRLGLWSEAKALQTEFIRLIRSMRERLKNIFSVPIEIPETLDEQRERLSLVPTPAPPSTTLEAPTLGSDNDYRFFDILE